MLRQSAYPVRNHSAIVPCISLALARCPLSRGLDPAEVEAIAATASIQAVSARSPVFEEGQAPRGLWVLVEGQVRLHHAHADGASSVVGFGAPYSPLDVASVLDGRPHLTTATASDDAVLLLIPRQGFLRFAAQFPSLMANAVDAVCRELRQRDIVATITTFKDARGRVGCALLQLAREFGRPTACGTIRIDYRLTRRDLAERAGVTLETAIRILSDYQRQGIVRTHAQVIEIVDQARLEAPTGCESCQFDCSVFGRRPRPVPPGDSVSAAR